MELQLQAFFAGFVLELISLLILCTVSELSY